MANNGTDYKRIDWTKPLQTIDGREVKLLDVSHYIHDGGDAVVKVINQGTGACPEIWFIDCEGMRRVRMGPERPTDVVINSPQKQQVRYLNVYKSVKQSFFMCGVFCLSSNACSLEGLDSLNYFDKKQWDPEPVACVKVEFAEGQFDE